MSYLYNLIFFEPLLNGLVLLVNYLPFHDLGFATILLTIIVRLIIFPFTHKATVTQVRMKKLEPELKEIKEKHKGDQQAQAKKTMELYKQHGINPLSGILTLFIQIPVIFALYKVFLGGVNFDPNHLYSFVSIPEAVNVKFLGLIDMTQKGYVLPFLAAVTQFFQMKLAIPPIKKEKLGDSFKDNLARSMNLQMRYVMPIFIFFIGLRFFSGIALYWTTMNVFAIVHEATVRRKAEKLYGGTTNKNNLNAS
ncbi:membrane protein insertase YidC [Candidatus Parcubacteria bacterium]|nr:MAG: membrane protein insertase YidC [Candidatus Parcubacteria bacterium]